MSSIKNVILIGAGGNLGPAILEQFIASPFNVTVLSRKESKSTFPSGVNVIKADYTDATSLAPAFRGQDAVISLVGGTGLGDQNKFIDAAISAGVKRFIPSEFGSDTLNDTLRAIVPPFHAKKAAVDYLKSKEKEISWTSLITGAFFDWGLTFGTLGPKLQTKTAEVFDDGTAPFQATNLSTIGKALVSILQHDAETRNQYVYISSFTTSQAELVALVEKISGSKWPTKNQKASEVLEDASKRFQNGDYSAIPDLIRGSIYGEKGLGDYSSKGLWNDRLGLEKESLEQTVKTVVAGKL